MIRRYPYTEEVLKWHGVEVGDRERLLSLHALCWMRGLDFQRVMTDVEAVAFNDDEWEDPLGDQDEWTMDYTTEDVERLGAMEDDEDDDL